MIARKVWLASGSFLLAGAAFGTSAIGCGAIAVTDACAVDTDCNPGRVCLARVCVTSPVVSPSDAGVDATRAVDGGGDGGSDEDVSVSNDGAPPTACFSAVSKSLVVLFGGEDGPGLNYGDTWLFDGTTWTQGAWCRSPSPREAPSMATLGTSVVLFGGGGESSLLADTWTFDGTGWTELTGGTAPPARFAQSMTTQGASVMMFGGSGNGLADMLGDTWTFDGTSWTQVSASGPPPRYGTVLGALGAASLLFGGYGAVDGGGDPIADTWSFSGATWTERTPQATPSARFDAAMAPLGGKVILFGGSEISDDSGLGFLVGDTWAFDGASWTPITGGAAPSARASHGMTTFGDKIVLFGGTDTNGDELNDTWTFDGTSWEELTVASAPPGRDSFGMATLSALP